MHAGRPRWRHSSSRSRPAARMIICSRSKRSFTSIDLLSEGMRLSGATRVAENNTGISGLRACSLEPPFTISIPFQEDFFMNNFSSFRRDFLRTGSLGMAAAAIPAVSLAAAKEKAAASSSGIFDVRSFGATGDGKTLDTNAVNHAIEAAEAAGGGVVLFPPGMYLCFSIHLKSHVRLHLEEGSAIVAAESPLPGQTTGYNGGVYDAAEPKTEWDAYQDYGHNHWHNSLLWGENIHDLSITGTGLIYGKGLSFGAGRAARGNYPIYVAEQAGVGNKAIALKNCRNVTFRDFSMLKGGHFALLLTGVDNLTIDNLKIDTDRDGIDIDCCQNVRVSNCTVNSPWDDGICPKSSYALGYARPTRNVTIANCWVTGDRLLSERPRLQLHRELALGRRHLSQVELFPRLCAAHKKCDHRQLLGNWRSIVVRTSASPTAP